MVNQVLNILVRGSASLSYKATRSSDRCRLGYLMYTSGYCERRIRVKNKTKGNRDRFGDCKLDFTKIVVLVLWSECHSVKILISG